MWYVVCIFAVLKCVKCKMTDFESFILNIFRKNMNIHVQVHFPQIKGTCKQYLENNALFAHSLVIIEGLKGNGT